MSPLANIIFGALLIPLTIVVVLPTGNFGAAIAYAIAGGYLIAYGYRDLKARERKNAKRT